MGKLRPTMLVGSRVEIQPKQLWLESVLWTAMLLMWLLSSLSLEACKHVRKFSRRVILE